MVTDKLEVLVFGIAKDIMGGSKIILELQLPSNVDLLKQQLLIKYPQFQDMRSFAVAVNNEYSSGEDPIHPLDEVAIIPPVSGG